MQYFFQCCDNALKKMEFITALFSKALDGVNVKEMISNISSGVGAAPAAGGAAPAAAAAAPAEDKKGNATFHLSALMEAGLINKCLHQIVFT